jgi:hypothetical protein
MRRLSEILQRFEEIRFRGAENPMDLLMLEIKYAAEQDRLDEIIT